MSVRVINYKFSVRQLKTRDKILYFFLMTHIFYCRGSENLIKAGQRASVERVRLLFRGRFLSFGIGRILIKSMDGAFKQ